MSIAAGTSLSSKKEMELGRGPSSRPPSTAEWERQKLRAPKSCLQSFEVVFKRGLEDSKS